MPGQRPLDKKIHTNEISTKHVTRLSNRKLRENQRILCVGKMRDENDK